MLAQVAQTSTNGASEAAAPAAPRLPGIERPRAGPHGAHHSPSPTRMGPHMARTGSGERERPPAGPHMARTGSGERERPPAGPHMARTGSGERQRLGRLSASSGGSVGGAPRPAYARQGSMPLRERLNSMQRQGSLAARQVRRHILRPCIPTNTLFCTHSHVLLIAATHAATPINPQHRSLGCRVLSRWNLSVVLLARRDTERTYLAGAAPSYSEIWNAAPMLRQGLERMQPAGAAAPGCCHA